MAVALVLLLTALGAVLVASVRGGSASAAAGPASAESASLSADAALTGGYGLYAEGVVAITLGDTISVTGEGATVHGSTVTIEAAGVYSLSGTLEDGRVIVDAKGKVYLEFDGVHITSSSGPALFVADAKKVTVTLVEGTSNSLSDSAGNTEHDAALYSNDTLVINGRGSLAVNGNSSEGIAGDDDIIINAGVLVVTAIDDGLNAHDEIKVTGGDLYVMAGGNGLDSNDIITITGGTVIATGDSFAALSGDSSQGSVYVSTGATQAAGTSVSIVRDGEEILAFAPDKEYRSLLISSAGLLAGTTYEVYIGSSVSSIRIVLLQHKDFWIKRSCFLLGNFLHETI